MARPPIDPTFRRLCVRVGKPTRDRLAGLVRSEGVSVAEIVRRAVDAYRPGIAPAAVARPVAASPVAPVPVLPPVPVRRPSFGPVTSLRRG